MASPWLILGKGPSSAKYDQRLTENYLVLALNHAMRCSAADVGHLIDIELLDQLQASDLDSVRYLCLPRVPHVRKARVGNASQAFFGPGTRTLADYANEHPLLAKYSAAGRLLSYNLVSAPKRLRHPDFPAIEGRTFSAAIAMRLLVASGAPEVRTLGVDGGAAYADKFKDVEGTTKLQTGQGSFDSQFTEMAETVCRSKVTFGPLDVQVPARVFVGAEPEQELAFLVLAHSIRKHSSTSVSVQRLDTCIQALGLGMPVPDSPSHRPRTPFSFQRFHIPRLCDFSGRAIYLDSDMLVRGDLRELWTHAMRSNQMVSAQARAADSATPPQFNVMLIDCDALRWDLADIVRQLDAGTLSYEDLMFRMKTVARHEASLSADWNSLEYFKPGKTRLVHFTEMNRQPWLNAFHGHAQVWTEALIQAMDDGAISEADVVASVDAGHVRPQSAGAGTPTLHGPLGASVFRVDAGCRSVHATPPAGCDDCRPAPVQPGSLSAIAGVGCAFLHRAACTEIPAAFACSPCDEAVLVIGRDRVGRLAQLQHLLHVGSGTRARRSYHRYHRSIRWAT